MARVKVAPTGVEKYFGEDEIIVSKTDLTGKICYANDVFLKVSGFSEDEVIGQPHSMIRHPDMPRAVFKLLWESIESGNEIFAYVVNICKNGDHYWVYAHVTPSYNDAGRVVGYHSNRRVPERRGLEVIQPIYRKLLEEESRHSDPRKGLQASYELFGSLLLQAGKKYDEFIWDIA